VSGWVAGLCVLGLVTGVAVAVVSGHSAAPTASPRVTPSPVNSLPKVRPQTGNGSVVPGFNSSSPDFSVPAVQLTAKAKVAPLRAMHRADMLIVSSAPLPHSTLAAVLKQTGVATAEQIEAVRMRIDGTYTAVLGVDPSVFRSYAAKPTAASDALWNGVANGDIAVSYEMGRMDHLALGGDVTASGTTAQKLQVGAYGTMGIGGVDAVVSDAVAHALGMPMGNAIVVSVTSPSDVTNVTSRLHHLLPAGDTLEPLVRVIQTVAPGSASNSHIGKMLQAAWSRRGLPYVWGGSGPKVFDCSGLVQWSFRQAGVTMPRVAADQALTGPSVPVGKLRAGDLLFYHTDPTAPNYISHVAIYLGNGWMIQAPAPGMYVEVVPADFGSEFAGAIQVNPTLAAQVAAQFG
jgi:cell wall-associated NlpC family hydrolase